MTLSWGGWWIHWTVLRFSLFFVLLSCSSARCELAQWCAIHSAEEVSSGGGETPLHQAASALTAWFPSFIRSVSFALTSLWKNINDKRFDRAQATFWARHSPGRTGSAQVCAVKFFRYHGSFWETEFWIAYFCMPVSSFFLLLFYMKSDQITVNLTTSIKTKDTQLPFSSEMMLK